MKQVFPFSKTFVLAPFLALSLIVYGCGSSTPQASGDSVDTTAEVPTESSAPADETPEETAVSASEIDIPAIIGTTEEGWLPKVVAGIGLQRGMSPEEAGQLVPGAEAIDEFGFSEVPVTDVPGIQQYKFTFLDNDAGEPELYSITLIFDPTLKSVMSYEELANALAVKYGEVDPADVREERAFWIGPGFASASLTNLGTDFDGYEFDVVIPD